MRKSLFRCIGFVLAALAVSAASAADSFTQKGFGSPVEVAAQALPDNSGAPVAAADVKDHGGIAAQPGAKLASCRTCVDAPAKSVKPWYLQSSINQTGAQADRGAKVRWAFS